jgi:prevent-host-death family protein
MINNQTIGAFEIKTHLSKILDEVEKGEQITITKHGRPVAKLVPISSPNREQVHQTILSLKEFSKSNKLDGLDWKQLKSEGRK